jgi:hypothetical protein
MGWKYPRMRPLPYQWGEVRFIARNSRWTFVRTVDKSSSIAIHTAIYVAGLRAAKRKEERLDLGQLRAFSLRALSFLRGITGSVLVRVRCLQHFYFALWRSNNL